MSRQRRRKANEEVAAGSSTEEAWGKQPDKKVMFMEEVNYKMEIEEEGCSQQVLLKKEEFNDQ